uniref:Uncharacterized protein n=1 Tax=Glossina austeni TaxID=7395 RepID=A0A1A9VAB7_GLOAU
MKTAASKKIERHVLKAVNTLNRACFHSGVEEKAILGQVRRQMTNVAPVRNVGRLVRQSLRKLIDDGLVHRTIAEGVVVFSSSTKRYSIKSQKSSFSQLDPNKPRTECLSEESLSGDEFERTLKRLRSNNRKVRYSGRPVPLPKKREHARKVNERANALIKSMDAATDFDGLALRTASGMTCGNYEITRAMKGEIDINGIVLMDQRKKETGRNPLHLINYFIIYDLLSVTTTVFTVGTLELTDMNYLTADKSKYPRFADDVKAFIRNYEDNISREGEMLFESVHKFHIDRVKSLCNEQHAIIVQLFEMVFGPCSRSHKRMCNCYKFRTSVPIMRIEGKAGSGDTNQLRLYYGPVTDDVNEYKWLDSYSLPTYRTEQFRYSVNYNSIMEKLLETSDTQGDEFISFLECVEWPLKFNPVVKYNYPIEQQKTGLMIILMR